MKLFEVNFRRVLLDYLVVELRKPKLVAVLIACHAAIEHLYNRFFNYRERNLYRLAHGMHTTQLEAVLNDRFDIAFRRIRVVPAPLQYEPIYIYQDIEDRPHFIYTDSENKPQALYTDNEIEFGGDDFIVQVPYTLPYDTNQMTALVEDYKTPGKTFVIEETL
ncbi:hypothetical protein D3C72_535430 [compost metagenome]